LARVLLVDDDVTSRLTLQTVLRAGGYSVEVAASAAEAVEKLDTDHYDLVLSDLHMESDDAGLKVLAHARHKEYRPATALVTSYRSSEQKAVGRPPVEFMVETEGVQGLLMKVADLIGLRAIRRIQRLARQSAS
jgi:CheY-like chemotaxis protein